MPRSIPFRIKWAGGKRWLAPHLVSGLPASAFAGGVCEPFAGGAALSFSSPIGTALHLNDSNADLMNAYAAIRDAPEGVADILGSMPIDRPTFEQVKMQAPASPLQAAARFIYLNRTAFAGLWRVNAEGQFNVPFGCKTTTRMPTTDEMAETSARLAGSTLNHSDFEKVTSETSANLIYLDPPYTVTHNQNGFIRYNEKLFCWNDQERLADAAVAATDSGKLVLVSNALHSDVIALYRFRGFRLYRVRRINNLAPNTESRGVTEELLAVSENLKFVRLPPFASRLQR